MSTELDDWKQSAAEKKRVKLSDDPRASWRHWQRTVEMPEISMSRRRHEHDIISFPANVSSFRRDTCQLVCHRSNLHLYEWKRD